jgi:nitrate reductase gamma subunit
VEAWIQFGRGPLFRICFSLMVLGLLRLVVLTIVAVIEAYQRNADKIINWREVRKQTWGWLFPLGRLWRQRPAFGTLSVLFHVGLLVVPWFLAAHVLLWKRATGFSWLAIPQGLANYLTLLAIVAGLGLFASRFIDAGARKISRRQDFLWPLLLVVPFLTGYVCANAAIGPKTYASLMLIHVYSANLILLLIPFGKIAHCVLTPLSQVVTAVAWKFPIGAGDRVAATLGYADRPTWLPKSRLGAPVTTETGAGNNPQRGDSKAKMATEIPNEVRA